MKSASRTGSRIDLLEWLDLSRFLPIKRGGRKMNMAVLRNQDKTDTFVWLTPSGADGTMRA